MIGRRITIGIILALVAGLGALGWLYRAEIKQSAELAQTVLQQRTDMEEMEKQLHEAERMRREAEQIAADHQDQIAQITTRARDLREKLRDMEAENEKVRKWADTDIPDRVLDLVRGKDSRQD